MNKFDEKAREWSRKQARTAGEIRDRLTGIHLGRSKQARNSDEGKSAKLTRNPVEWARNPGRRDYPGIDTKDK